MSYSLKKLIPNRIRAWQVFLPLLIIANAAYIPSNFFGWIITLSFFLFVPGYLLLSLLKHEIQSRWEIASFSLGLSLAILIVGGLILNSLHGLGLTRPLTTMNIFTTLDVISLILVALNRTMIISLPLKLSDLSKIEIAVITALTSLPLLAISGAIRLNNGASNILTMILFASISFLFIALTLYRRKNLESVYPYAIIMMGLSVLFSVSLRGWFITGHDIQHEFYVFQLTSKAAFWNIKAFRDPYNACLSITILPTIIAKITTISAPYVFKVVFQMIFAFSLVPLFFFMKRLSNATVALMGSFVFISFPTFLNDMPFLNRQEIALVFFSLLILTTFLKMARKPKAALMFIWLIGLILSHYSSSYVTLGILILLSIFYKLLTLNRRKVYDSSSALPLLSMPIIIAALLLTFLWNAQITNTTSGLENTLTQSVKSIIDQSSAQSSDVSYSLFAPSTKSAPELLTTYAGNKTNQVEYVPQENLHKTKLGEIVSHIVDAGTLNSLLRDFSAKVLQVLLLVGVALLFFRQRKKATYQGAYFLALSIGCVVLLILQTLLPQLSVNYGTLRFFQQALVILSVPIVLGTESLLRFSSHTKIYMAIFFALLFLDLSGFIPQIIGDYPPQLSLNNSGTYYSAYYVHAGEINSSNWLVKNVGSHKLVAADSYARLRLLSATTTNQITAILPLNKSSHDYFYQDYSNISNNLYFVVLQGDIVQYILNDNYKGSSNLLYVNQASDIYGP